MQGCKRAGWKTSDFEWLFQCDWQKTYNYNWVEKILPTPTVFLHQFHTHPTPWSCNASANTCVPSVDCLLHIIILPKQDCYNKHINFRKRVETFWLRFPFQDDGTPTRCFQRELAVSSLLSDYHRYLDKLLVLSPDHKKAQMTGNRPSPSLRAVPQ